MSSGRFITFIVTGVLLLIAATSFFTVDERELAIKLRVGEVVQTGYEPGLHWRIPVFETVQTFPRRILTISSPRPERVFTAENESLDVDFFVKYRIVDPVRFYTSTGGFLDVASSRLGEIVKNAVVTEFGERTVSEAISESNSSISA